MLVIKIWGFEYVEKFVENRGNYQILLGYSLVSNVVFASKNTQDAVLFP